MNARLNRVRRQKEGRIAGIRKKSLRDALYIFVFVMIVTGIVKPIFNSAKQTVVNVTQARAQTVEVAPLYHSILISPTSTPTPTPLPKPAIETPEQHEIADYIREVFGAHADRALYLLTCENSDLNPEIVNTAGNFPAGSRDIGIFQINEYWQGVNARFLFNWRINVQMAYQIFAEDGYSFKLWTCGRKLGV